MRKPNGTTGWIRIFVLSACVLCAPTESAVGDVVINMPPPKPTPVQSSAPSNTAPAMMQPDVGDVALQRYAKARTGTYDTYEYGPRYAGIRSYGYPYPLFWGWPSIGCFGNTFVGFVGCSRSCSHSAICAK